MACPKTQHHRASVIPRAEAHGQGRAGQDEGRGCTHRFQKGSKSVVGVPHALDDVDALLCEAHNVFQCHRPVEATHGRQVRVNTSCAANNCVISKNRNGARHTIFSNASTFPDWTGEAEFRAHPKNPTPPQWRETICPSPSTTHTTIKDTSKRKYNNKSMSTSPASCGLQLGQSIFR